MIRPLLLALCLVTPACLASPALAQEGGTDAAADGAAPPQRVRSVILFGDETCPKPQSADEVVICARPGESPYRIPKVLRQTDPGPAGTSWVRRAELIDEVNRVTLPGSCSPVGTFGQSGCTMQMLQQWRAEQKAKKAQDAAIPRAEDPGN